MKSLLLKTLLVCCVAAAVVSAHCDSLDGPVVNAARAALESGDVIKVLIWVHPPGEAEVRKAFQKAMDVRRLNPQARELADLWFFETAVRVHRAGEGAPYEGLKLAGRDVGQAIPAADRAIATGSVEALSKTLTAAVQGQIEKRFQRVNAAKSFASGDLKAGREYVAAYVEFIHFAERVHSATASSEAHTGEHEH